VLVLLLKITVAPAFVACATLVGRRFGPNVSGWLMGFPVIAGPVLWFYAREQGTAFAAHAAAGTLLGVLSLCLFLLLYAWAARRYPWWACLLAGWVAFSLANLAMVSSPHIADAPWPAGLAASFVAVALTRRWSPAASRQAAAAGPPPRDLALRVAAAATLVVALTALANVVGPTLSGLFTPFPVGTTILVVFAHREGGPGAVVAVYGGFIPSLFSFCSFCAALSWGLGRGSGSIAGPFALALLISVLIQAVVLILIGRRDLPGTS
jgi:hypothetical protein